MIMVCTAGDLSNPKGTRCAFVAARLNITYVSASMVPKRLAPALAARSSGGHVGLSVAANVLLLVGCITLIAMLISCEKAFKRCYEYAASKSKQLPNQSNSNAVSAYSDMANLLSLRGKR